MLDPKRLTAFDETTALGIATLWNDAMPGVRNKLDQQIDDIDAGIRLVTECNSEACDTHDKHREGDETCACWACQNGGLPGIASDLRYWLDDLDTNGTTYGHEATPEGLLGLVTDWLYVNVNVPEARVPAYQLGAVYRLAAELADQANAKFAAMAPGAT